MLLHCQLTRVREGAAQLQTKLADAELLLRVRTVRNEPFSLIGPFALTCYVLPPACMFRSAPS